MTHNTKSRQSVVAAIITDFWPHRMSLAAAEAIDRQYAIWVSKMFTVEYRVVWHKARGDRFVYEGPDLRAAKLHYETYRDSVFDASIEQRQVGRWERRGKRVVR